MSSYLDQRVTSPARLDALARTGLLDLDDPRFDQIARLATSLLGVPVSLVSLLDADRQVFVGEAGLGEPWATARETPLSHSFCQHVVADASALVVSDAREHPVLRDNLAIRDLDVVAYLGVPLTTPDGFTLGSFCVIDSSPRTWTEAELEIVQDLARLVRTEIALAESERARRGASATGELLASLAHDLRGMVTAIAGGARTLARVERLSDADRVTVAGIVERQALALERLLTQLLDFGALEAGSVSVQTAEVDVTTLLHDVVEGYRMVGAAVVLAPTPGDEPIMAFADPLYLRRCLNNLVDNAHKHAGRGVTVTVSAVVEGGRVRIAVADDGDGLEQQDLVGLFDARQQGTGSGRGYGLGLHVVRSLTEAMAGDVTVTSERGAGTTFTISLPLA